MFHGHLDYSQKSPLGGRPNNKPGDHGTLNARNRWFILFYHVWRPGVRSDPQMKGENFVFTRGFPTTTKIDFVVILT